MDCYKVAWRYTAEKMGRHEIKASCCESTGQRRVRVVATFDSAQPLTCGSSNCSMPPYFITNWSMHVILWEPEGAWTGQDIVRQGVGMSTGRSNEAGGADLVMCQDDTRRRVYKHSCCVCLHSLSVTVPSGLRVDQNNIRDHGIQKRLDDCYMHGVTPDTRNRLPLGHERVCRFTVVPGRYGRPADAIDSVLLSLATDMQHTTPHYQPRSVVACDVNVASHATPLLAIT